MLPVCNHINDTNTVRDKMTPVTFFVQTGSELASPGLSSVPNEGSADCMLSDLVHGRFCVKGLSQRTVPQAKDAP